MTSAQYRLPAPKLLTAALALGLLVAAPQTATAGHRVVAVGDIHGEYQGLLGILGAAGLIDAEARWAGDDTVLVQTGDILDRGAHVRQVMDLLMRLQSEASAAGGRVVVLLGNHEGMNLLGITRDVNPKVYAQWADDDSEERRRLGYEHFKRVHLERAEQAGDPPPVFTEQVEQQWRGAYPPGKIEYLRAMAADGVYGRWLRSCPVILRLDRTIFVHGGISPALTGLSIGEINQRAAAELGRFDSLKAALVAEHLVEPHASIYAVDTVVQEELRFAAEVSADDSAHDRRRKLRARRWAALSEWRQWLLIDPDGPVWFRGAARWDEFEQDKMMAQILSSLKAERMVVGHTVRESGLIQTRFDGRVVLIDTGMLTSHYKGRASALELNDGNMSAIYTGGRVTLTP